jgi:hypothetical protein
MPYSLTLVHSVQTTVFFSLFYLIYTSFASGILMHDTRAHQGAVRRRGCMAVRREMCTHTLAHQPLPTVYRRCTPLSEPDVSVSKK